MVYLMMIKRKFHFSKMWDKVIIEIGGKWEYKLHNLNYIIIVTICYNNKQICYTATIYIYFETKEFFLS